MNPTRATPSVRLVRNIPASPDRVYRAWLDPELIRRWFAPTGLTVTNVTVDERIGGRHSVEHADERGDVGGFESELLELVPNERIVFGWGFVGPDHHPDPAHDSLLTVELRLLDDGHTELTLIHERLDGLRASRPEIADGVAGGWDQALSGLADVVTA